MVRPAMHAKLTETPLSEALRFDELQASMALFAEALHGGFVRLDTAQDLQASEAPANGRARDEGARVEGARVQAARPDETRIVLRERYDEFNTRALNLGACHVDILRQLILLRQDRSDPAAQPDPQAWGELLLRIFLALQALCRDMMLRRDFPGARADLERALQRARETQTPQIPECATSLQARTLSLLEALARGTAHGPIEAQNVLQTALRLAQACARPGAQLSACLPRALHISKLLGLPIPGTLLNIAPLSLADQMMLADAGPDLAAMNEASKKDASNPDTTKTESGKDEDGAAQHKEEHASSADGGELSRRHGQPGESTAQVPDFFELKGFDPNEPSPVASEAGKPRLSGRPEARALRSFLYPEWHYTERRYWPAWCRVHEHRLRGEDSQFIRDVRQRHAALAREVRQRLAAIRPNQLQRVARNLDGEEPDLEALINRVADRHAGHSLDDRLYVQRQRARREVSAAFLVDMSGSTNISMPSKADKIRAAMAPPEEDSPYLYGGGMFAASETRPPMRRVIDVAKDALALMCDGLQGLGDRFAVYGFSGDGRKQVDFYIAKDFDEPLSGRTWAALSAIEPKRSSRLGPAIRHAVRKFRGQSDVQRLLIIISDGYPQDSDYGPDPDEVEYGIQDSARAMAEATKAGIQTFFITIDPAGQDYMGRICNERSSMLIDDIAELPLALSKVYGGMRRR